MQESLAGGAISTAAAGAEQNAPAEPVPLVRQHHFQLALAAVQPSVSPQVSFDPMASTSNCWQLPYTCAVRKMLLPYSILQCTSNHWQQAYGCACTICTAACFAHLHHHFAQLLSRCALLRAMPRVQIKCCEQLR